MNCRWLQSLDERVSRHALQRAICTEIAGAMQERLEARGSGQSFEPQSAGRSPSRQTSRAPCCSWQAVDSGANEGICGVAAPRFRGDFNRLRYPVLKCAAPVDDASLRIQGRANRPRGLAVSLIQSIWACGPDGECRRSFRGARANGTVSIQPGRRQLCFSSARNM